MSDIYQYLLPCAVLLPLYYYLKPYVLRKWLGLVLTIGGLIAAFKLPYEMNGLDTGAISLGVYMMGLSLFSSRRKFLDDED